jgi:hypothetical protein
MGKMENPGAPWRDATGAGKSENTLTSPQYRQRAERATTLCLAIADCEAEDAAPILWAALDDFHRQGMPESPLYNLMQHATEWAEWASERELKAYAVAAARRMDPSTRESFRLYLAGGA